MDFSAALEQAARFMPTPPLATTSPQHLSPDVGVQRSTLEFAQFVQPAQTNLDGNTVDLIVSAPRSHRTPSCINSQSHHWTTS